MKSRFKVLRDLHLSICTSFPETDFINLRISRILRKNSAGKWITDSKLKIIMKINFSKQENISKIDMVSNLSKKFHNPISSWTRVMNIWMYLKRSGIYIEFRTKITNRHHILFLAIFYIKLNEFIWKTMDFNVQK